MWRAAVVVAALAGCQSPAQTPYAETGAVFDAPTERYDHGVLGDKIEYGGLIVWHDRYEVTLTLTQTRVFEDLEPRLADLDGDGVPEVVIVETDMRLGAQLAVYGLQFDGQHLTGIHKIAATAPIGRKYRWLAPVGIADFNQDGVLDIAYVETPHLGKILKVVSLDGDKLELQATLSGFSNHSIGENFISGGVRECGGRPEMIVADAGWTRVMAVRLMGDRLEAYEVGPIEDADSFASALSCQK